MPNFRIQKVSRIFYYDPRPCQQTITINILPNIGRNKAKQTIKFSHLME